MLTLLDLGVILAYLGLALAVGLAVSGRAGRSGEEFFLAGRSLPGWLIGLSIVATTFAADTPLAIAGMVLSKGIAANWFWWSMGIAHVGLFLFWAKLWRRAEVTTDAELVALRYGGIEGEALRSAKAVYFALVYNAIVLGWVITAVRKIVRPFVDWEVWLGSTAWAQVESSWPGQFLGGPTEGLAPCILVLFAAVYSTLGGLRGVVFTDLVQLLLAGVGSVALVLAGYGALQGEGTLAEQVAARLGPDLYAERLAFLPGSGDLSYLSVEAFAVYLFVRWWASATGDGGGYIAQRLMASRSPRDAQVGAGVFVALHYVVRPWPWILAGLLGIVLFEGSEGSAVIPAGLAALVAEDPEMVYPALAAWVMQPGLLGLLLASLLAAFMSTVDTHLNWGVSYLAHDLWRGRFRPGASPSEIARVGRASTVLLALAALVAAHYIASIEGAWKFVAGISAGLGLPVLLRWLWWRASAWVEMAGGLTGLLASLLIFVVGKTQLPLFGPVAIPWEFGLAITVAASALAALSAAFVFPPPSPEVLEKFYLRVRPPGLWAPVAKRVDESTGSLSMRGVGIRALLQAFSGWASCGLGLFLWIFAPGHLLLDAPLLGVVELVAGTALWALGLRLARTGWEDLERPPAQVP